MSELPSQRLLRDLAITGDSEHDEASCQAIATAEYDLLSRYIAYEIDHPDVRQAYSAVWRHIHVCDDCWEDYQRMLHEYIENQGLLEVYRESGESAADSYPAVARHLRRCASCNEVFDLLTVLAESPLPDLLSTPSLDLRRLKAPLAASSPPEQKQSWLGKLIGGWATRVPTATLGRVAFRNNSKVTSGQHMIELQSLGFTVTVTINYDLNKQSLYGSISPEADDLLETMLRLYELNDSPTLVATTKIDLFSRFEFSGPIEPAGLILTIALPRREEPLLIFSAASFGGPQ